MTVTAKSKLTPLKTQIFLVDKKPWRQSVFRVNVTEPNTSPATPSLLLDIISKSLLTKAELIALYLLQLCHKLPKPTVL